MAFLSTFRVAGILTLLSLQALGAVLHEQLPGIPAGWSVVGAPKDDTEIVLQIALVQQNLDKLESKLMAVSHPHSPSYGKYLDREDVNAMFGPSEASSASVQSWLKASGIKQYSAQGHSIWFKSTVSKANAMLDTTFFNFVDFAGVTKLRTTHYSVPKNLVHHIDLISPTTYFGKTKAHFAIPAAAASASLNVRDPSGVCNMSIQSQNETIPVFGPACLQAQYNINGYVPDPMSGSTIGFGSFLNESASFSDLAMFEEYFGIPSDKYVGCFFGGGQG